MIFLFYLALLVGGWLLLLDVSGRSVTGRRRAAVMRAVGVASAVLVGAYPLLGWQLGGWIVGPGAVFPIVASAYLLLSMAFVGGVMLRRRYMAATWLSRGAYIGLLLVGALPSWVLLTLTPAIALAGVALVGPARGGMPMRLGGRTPSPRHGRGA